MNNDRRRTDAEQMQARQSGPRETPQEYAAKIRDQSARGAVLPGASKIADVIDAPINDKVIAEATDKLRRYKSGKANLDSRIIRNEEWYKLRHWGFLQAESKKTPEEKKQEQITPTSGWLFNSLANKHADAMDNFPAPNILPREEGDKAEAEKLTSIVPVILDQCEFEQTYSDVQTYKLKSGTGVYGVFWDASKLNGMGDISINKVDILNLFWQPGVTDIQKSPNLFHIETVDNEALEAAYPELQGKLGSATIAASQYIYDDNIDTSDKSVVVDWYYKKKVNGRTILHYCKFCNGIVLYATENERQPITDEFGNVIKPAPAEAGLYDHGMYPFVFDVQFPVEGSPAGFGYIDVGKSAQEYIDLGNQAILQNMISGAKPRYFTRKDGGVNPDDVADFNKTVIEVEGSLDETHIRPVDHYGLDGVYVSVINNKIEELKETTGNRDVSNGGTSSGATAASAIAAMQEAGSKLSRDANKSSFRAFRKVILIVVELIRQFYDIPRQFRIIGENGMQKFISFDNSRIAPQTQEPVAGRDMGMRLPLFDIEITAQKASAYSKMSQNELALQFYQQGFFAPNNADQALACLDMMDFDRKSFVEQKVQQNGTMYQTILMMQKQMLALAQIADRANGTNLAAQLAAQITGSPMPASTSGRSADISETEALGGEAGPGESKITKKARQETAERTAPV